MTRTIHLRGGGGVVNNARHDDPAFVPSLALLVQRERYSLTDIGLMFGVSRERARQWCVKYGIEHPDSARGLLCIRVWDDVQLRFVPVPRAVLRRQRAVTRTAVRKAEHERDIGQRRAAIIAVTKALAGSLGRSPSLTEIGRALGMKGSHRAIGPLVVSAWGGRYSLGTKGVISEIHAATGTSASMRRRAPQTHCLRGHALAETRHPKWGYCTLCARERSRSKRARKRAHPQRGGAAR